MNEVSSAALIQFPAVIKCKKVINTNTVNIFKKVNWKEKGSFDQLLKAL